MAATASRLFPITATLLAALASFTASAWAAGTSLAVNRLKIVDASGSASANCQALLDTLAGITDAAETKRYVVRLEPGTYDCGSTGVSMKSWVDLEGSGREVTLLTGTSVQYVLLGRANAEARHLTIEQTAGNFAVVSGESVRISHAVIKVTGGDTLAGGVYSNSGANPILTDVDIEVEASGLESAWGIANVTAAPLLRGVRIRVEGAQTCKGIESSSNDPLAPLEPLVIRDVEIYVHGNVETYGVHSVGITDPPVEIFDAVIRVRGDGDKHYGVYNESSDAIIRNSTIEALRTSSGPLGEGFLPTSLGFQLDFYGVYNAGGSPGEGNGFTVQVDNSQIVSQEYGIYNEAGNGTHEVEVTGSRIRGPMETVHNDAEYTTRIGGSLMSGGASVAGGGTLICAGVWDEAGVFSASSCP